MEKREKIIISIIGDSFVGKSSLMMQYVNKTFSDKPTIGVDFLSKDIQIDGKLYNIQIRDTGGQERFRTVTSGFYRGAHGFLLVYDITLKESFENIDIWLDEVEKNTKGTDSVKYIIGNKLDLNEKRRVRVEEVKEKAENFEIKFYETSAMEYEQIEDIIQEMVLEIVNNKITSPPRRLTQSNDTQKVDIQNGNNNSNNVHHSCSC